METEKKNNPKNSAALLKLADSLKEGDTAEVKRISGKRGEDFSAKALYFRLHGACHGKCGTVNRGRGIKRTD